MPSDAMEATEREASADYSSTEAAQYFVRQPASDVMVEVLRALDIDYVATNPAASFRGLHESIVNYAGNTRPELLTCLHEESAVALGQGYAKAARKPLAVMCDGVVGLQHAAMAVYNAWCDRVPVLLIAGNYADATERRAPVEWAHSANDPAELLRDFIKWDDMPRSLGHFVESTVRALRIAVTPPMGPTVIVADAAMQEREVDAPVPRIPALAVPRPPQGDGGAVNQAAELLAASERPLIIADRMARTATGMQRLIELAELLQAPVIDKLGRLNFPTDHYLNQTWRAGPLVREADLIIGLEVQNFWGSLNRMRERVEREQQRAADPEVKLISLGMSDLYLKSNYQDFQRYLGVDLSIAGDAEATLPALVEAVKERLLRADRAAREARARQLRSDFQAMRERARQEAAVAWNASPISTARLCMELWRHLDGRDWCLVSEPFFQGYWPHRLWVMNRPEHYLGGSGGYGVGYAAPGAVGAALGFRGTGRICVNLQPDGDLLYAPGVLWTAAHHRIPLLFIVHNNRAYHQEVMQVQKMALQRQRGVNGTAKIGSVFEDPLIDFTSLAKSMGVWSEGPIADPDQLGAALGRALAIVEQGAPALVDVIAQPR
jgi:thiamine pyrophosphate-dependent acetolactate synthase large subunit-like protein